MKALESANLRLRALEPEDVDAIFNYENNTDEWEFGGLRAPLSRESIRTYAFTYDADPFTAGQLRMMAVNKETGEAVGMVDLYDVSADDRRAMVGIAVFDDMRGRGYATEMLGMLDRYARDVLGLEQLAAHVTATNEASCRLFAKCGYREAGTLLHWRRFGHTWADVRIFQKLLIQ